MKNTTLDNRRFRRVPVRMPVKLLIENLIEAKGMIIAMSAGNMTIASRHPMKLGDKVIAYVNGKERLSGVVARTMGNVFAVRLKLPKVKQQRIVELLAIELAKQDGLIAANESIGEKRSALRRKCEGRESLCTLSNGDMIKCSVLDISLTGLGIEIEPVLQVGEIVKIGKINARVVREITNGYGLELIKVESPDVPITVPNEKQDNCQIAA